CADVGSAITSAASRARSTDVDGARPHRHHRSGRPSWRGAGRGAEQLTSRWARGDGRRTGALAAPPAPADLLAPSPSALPAPSAWPPLVSLPPRALSDPTRCAVRPWVPSGAGRTLGAGTLLIGVRLIGVRQGQRGP